MSRGESLEPGWERGQIPWDPSEGQRSSVGWDREAWKMAEGLGTAWRYPAKAAQEPFIPLKLAGALSSQGRASQMSHKLGPLLQSMPSVPHLTALWSALLPFKQGISTLPSIFSVCAERQGGMGREEGQRVLGAGTGESVSHPGSPISHSFPSLDSTWSSNQSTGWQVHPQVSPSSGNTGIG